MDDADSIRVGIRPELQEKVDNMNMLVHQGKSGIKILENQQKAKLKAISDLEATVAEKEKEFEQGQQRYKAAYESVEKMIVQQNTYLRFMESKHPMYRLLKSADPAAEAAAEAAATAPLSLRAQKEIKMQQKQS